MILTTEQQAHNFALYALQNDTTLEGLNHETLVAGLCANIAMVFGGHTFTEDQIRNISETAIDWFDEVA